MKICWATYFHLYSPRIRLQNDTFSWQCRTVVSFFIVGVLSKNVDHHGWLAEDKKLKKALAKMPKSSHQKKLKFISKHKWSKMSYLDFFWKYYFGNTIFYIHPHAPVDITRVCFNFIFSSRKSQSQQNLATKITRFTIYSFAQKISLILRTSTHLRLKIILIFLIRKPFFCPSLNFLNIMLEIRLKFMSLFFLII